MTWLPSTSPVPVPCLSKTSHFMPQHYQLSGKSSASLPLLTILCLEHPSFFLESSYPRASGGLGLQLQGDPEAGGLAVVVQATHLAAAILHSHSQIQDPSEMCENELEYFSKSFGTGVFQITTIPLRITYYYHYMLLLRISFILYFTQGPLLKCPIHSKPTIYSAIIPCCTCYCCQG